MVFERVYHPQVDIVVPGDFCPSITQIVEVKRGDVAVSECSELL